MSGFLNETWRDVLGLISGVGVLIAIWQILRTKGAADATHKASEETLARLTSSFAQYVIATAKRQLSGARQSVDNEDWGGAAIRAAEMAEQATQMAQVFPSERGKWVETAARLRKWEATFKRMKREEPPAKQNTLAKWEKFAIEAATEFDRHHGALGGDSKG